jgi:hypothetical protein
MRGIGTPYEHDATSHPTIADFRTKLFDDPNPLAAQSCRKVGFNYSGTAVKSLTHELAPSFLNIQKINARSFNPD